MNMPSPSISTNKGLEFEKKLKSIIETVSENSERLIQIVSAARYLNFVSEPLVLGASVPAIMINLANLGLKVKSIYEKHNNLKNLDIDIRNAEQKNFDEKNPDEREYREKEILALKLIHNMICTKERHEIFYFCMELIRFCGKVVSCIPIPEAKGMHVIIIAMAAILEKLLYEIPYWCLNKVRDLAFEEYKKLKKELEKQGFIDKELENEIYKKRNILYKLFDIEKLPENQLKKRKENIKFILELIKLFSILEQKGVDIKEKKDVDIKEKKERIIMYVKACIDDKVALNRLYEFISYNVSPNECFENIKASLINTL